MEGTNGQMGNSASNGPALPISGTDLADAKAHAQDAKATAGAGRPFMEPASKTDANEKLRKSGRHKGDCQCERCVYNRANPKPGKSQATSHAQAPSGPGTENPLPFGIPGKDIVRPIFTTASSVMKRVTKFEKAGLYPNEIEEISNVWGNVVDKRAPAFIKEYGDIIAACVVSAGIIGRIKLDMDEEIERRMKEKEAKETGQQAATEMKMTGTV